MMVSRVYLAAAFARRDEMRAVASDLRGMGYEVTSSWISEDLELRSDDPVTADAAVSAAVRCLDDLRDADVCLMFSTPRDTADLGRGGRHAELGAALVQGIPVFLVGPDEHVFHSLVAARYDTWATCRAALQDAAAPIAA